MDIEAFYNSISMTIAKRHSNTKIPLSIHEFLVSLKGILTDKESDPLLKMTRMTILFEGFYRTIPENTELKKDLLYIKQQRWINHFGTPTVPFLLSFQPQIKGTSAYFTSDEKLNSQIHPWKVDQTSKLTPDNTNNLLVDIKTITEVLMPEQKEKTGKFIKTHNPSGGFTTTPCDPYSQKFIEYAEEIAKSGGRVLEIGAAFGAASLQALAKGATVFCNDIEPQNLAVIRNRHSHEVKCSKNSVTGDDKKLVLVPGIFPEELSALPEESFDAILICRVLHFFPGKKIEEALIQMSRLLKPKGQLFIVCETPFLKNWQRFIPEHEKRVSAGVEWPGEISNPSEFESSGRAATLPSFVHWITKEILNRSLQRAGFFIAKSSYIDRKNQFPDDLLLSGQESVGAVGIKQ